MSTTTKRFSADTTGPPPLRRKSSGLLFASCLIAVSVLLAIGVGVLISAGLGRFGENVAPNAFDPERAAVHQWIDENANDGDWEEVRWWPAKVLTGKHEERLEMSREYIARIKKRNPPDPVEIKAEQELLAHLIERGPETACRIKWREQGPAGGPVLHDDLFFTRDGQVAGHVETTYAYEDDFPD